MLYAHENTHVNKEESAPRIYFYFLYGFDKNAYQSRITLRSFPITTEPTQRLENIKQTVAFYTESTEEADAAMPPPAAWPWRDVASLLRHSSLDL